MKILLTLLPIFIVAFTTFQYAYFFGIRGTADEIIFATLGLLLGPVFMFLGYNYLDTWGYFVSIVVMIIGFINICMLPNILIKIKNKYMINILK